MSLVETVIRRRLQRKNASCSAEKRGEEVARAAMFNALPLEEFHTLPPEDQELAEEVWAARIVEASLRRQEERRRLLPG